MAGSPTSRVWADTWDAECFETLARHLGLKGARTALGDEAYLPLVLPVLNPEGASEVDIARLKAALACTPEPLASVPAKRP